MSADAYQELVRIAERELELVRGGAHGELPALLEARGALVARLPAPAPLSARPHLERALALQAETSRVLEQSIGSLRDELGRLARGRGAISGYAHTAPTSRAVDHSG